MNLRVEGAYIYFTIPIFGGIDITQTTVSHLIVTIGICLACVYLGKNLHKRPGKTQALVEKGVILLRDMVAQTMGQHNVRWTSFIGTIFLSSLCGSLIGLTGFLRASTADLSCTLVWALMVTAIIWYNRIRHSGLLGWLKGFTQPIVVMTPMNLISEIAQPVSMAFRHFGNVAGGGVITALIYTSLSLASTALLNLICANGTSTAVILLGVGAAFLALYKRKGKTVWMLFGIISGVLGLFGIGQALGILTNVPILAYGIPGILSCYFDIFSGFVQAYVFTLLSMVYIAASLPSPDTTTKESK